jgi:hypothetical protein
MRLEDLKEFVQGWAWIETTVEIKNRPEGNGGAVWSPTGPFAAKVEIGTEADVESLYHELFHSVFHNSPLHRGKDLAWGDAWCDGFRYFHDARFKQKIGHYLGLTYAQAKVFGDWEHDRRYAYPCSLIISRCGGDFETFRSLWLRLCDRRSRTENDILDEFFSYDMVRGLPWFEPGRSEDVRP